MTKPRTLKDYFKYCTETLRANQALNNYCIEKFGSQPDIQIGVDEEDFPAGPENCAIRLIPGARSRTRGLSKRSHNIKLILFIKETGEDNNESQIRILSAIDYIDRFASLAEEAVIPATQISGIAITPLEGEPDQIIFPFARAELGYLIEIPAELPN